MTQGSYLRIAQVWNNFTYADTSNGSCNDDAQSSWYRFLLPDDLRPHGFMPPWIVERMPWTQDFVISHQTPRTVQLLDPSGGTDTARACTAALEKIVSAIAEQRIFRGFDPPSTEPFRIIGSKLPIFLSRTAAATFGIAIHGIHLIVYQQQQQQLLAPSAHDMKIWVPRRAPTSFSFPNYLDSAVGGGISGDDSPLETLLREAYEEASLDMEFVRKHARACGALTFMSVSDERTGYESGLMVPELDFVHELAVPTDLQLRPNDGEVGRYELMGVEQITGELKAGKFKPSAAAVMVDFLIRHGVITSENEPDYLSLIAHVHRPLLVPVAP